MATGGFVNLKFSMFFDKQSVLRAVDRAERRVLAKAGAFVRQRAKSAVRRRKRVRLRPRGFLRRHRPASSPLALLADRPGTPGVRRDRDPRAQGPAAASPGYTPQDALSSEAVHGTGP